MMEGNHEGTPPEGEEDALWRLLERARRPGPVSPYFARRVLREVAALEENRPAAGSAAHWLARTWQGWRRASALALAAVTLLAVGGAGLAWRQRQPAPAVLAAAAPSQPAVPDVDPEATAPPDVVPEAPAGGPSAVAVVTPEPAVTAQDVEVIADLDNVLSREESRLWTEDDTARF